MTQINTKAALEALVFLASEPVTEEDLAQVLGVSPQEVETMLDLLQADYERPERGIQLERVAGGVVFSTKADYASFIKEFYRPRMQQRMTQAALETLAIIAYRQPITRVEIEEIRGVKAEKALMTLMKKGLIKEAGRVEKTGTPILYATTKKFLDHFGLKDLSQLPDSECIKAKAVTEKTQDTE